MRLAIARTTASPSPEPGRAVGEPHARLEDALEVAGCDSLALVGDRDHDVGTASARAVTRTVVPGGE